jgi:capsular polysaccharide biosynthesis protein
MSFTDLVQKNIRFVIMLPILVAGLVFAISLFQKPLYKSSVSLLVVQKQDADIDARAAVKSAEQMADILARVVGTEAFRAAVLATGDVNVDLPREPWKRAKKWNKLVKTKNITDTGILVIDVYQPTSSLATRLTSSIEKVITTRGFDYLGVSGGTVSLRQLNPPAPTNNKPATPNLPLNTVIGWLFGVILAVSLILLFPNVNWNRFSVISFGGGGRSKSGYSYGEAPVPAPATRPVQTASGLIYSEKLEEAVWGSEFDEDIPPLPEEPPVVQSPKDSQISFVSRAEEIIKKQF